MHLPNKRKRDEEAERMSKALEKATQQFYAGRLKKAADTLWEVNFAFEGESEARAALALAEQLRDASDGGVRAAAEEHIARAESFLALPKEAPAVAQRPPLPLRRLGIASVVLCVLAAAVAGAVFLLTVMSLAYAYEGSDFDDPSFNAQVNAVVILIIAGGVLALVSAGTIGWHPRIGAILALVAVATGAIAFILPPFASPVAVVLWLPDTILLVGASAIGFVRQRRQNVDEICLTSAST